MEIPLLCETLASIMNTSNDIMVLTDTNLNFQYSNNHFLSFFHIEDKFESAKTVWEKIVEEAKFKDLNLADKNNSIKDYHFNLNISTYIHYRLQLCANIRMINEQREYVLFAMKDISPVENLKLELSETSMKYQILFETFPLGISLLDSEYRIVEINNMGCNLTRTPRDFVIGKKVSETGWNFVNLDKTPLHENQTVSYQAVKTNQTVHGKYGIQFGENDIMWMSVTATPFPVDGYSIIITYRDITDEIQLANQFNQNESILRDIVEDQTSLIARYHPDWKIVYVNPAFCTFFKKEFDDVKDSHIIDYFPDDFRSIFQSSIQNLTCSNPVGKFEVKFIQPNGKLHWISWVNRAIYDEEQHIVTFQSVGNDITYDKILEIKEKKVLDRLKEIYLDLQAFDEFTSEIEGKNHLQLDDLGITRQERIIIQLVIEGKTSKEIGNEIHVAESTVKKYLSDIYYKLGVGNRIEMINFIRAHNILL